MKGLKACTGYGQRKSKNLCLLFLTVVRSLFWNIQGWSVLFFSEQPRAKYCCAGMRLRPCRKYILGLSRWTRNICVCVVIFQRKGARKTSQPRVPQRNGPPSLQRFRQAVPSSAAVYYVETQLRPLHSPCPTPPRLFFFFFLNYYFYKLQDLPLTHTDCGEFFTAMRDLVFENRHPSRLASLASGSETAAAAVDSKGGVPVKGTGKSYTLCWKRREPVGKGGGGVATSGLGVRKCPEILVFN